MFFNLENEEVLEKSYENVKEGIDAFEIELSRRNTKFFGGKTPGKFNLNFIFLYIYLSKKKINKHTRGAVLLVTASCFKSWFTPIPYFQIFQMIKWHLDLHSIV